MLKQYLNEIVNKHKTDLAQEHSYRKSLEDLLRHIDSGIQVINEPKKQKCGKPDYIILRKNIPVGYIEAKDIAVNLDEIERSDQLKRYIDSLENLLLTNYLEFRFFVNGQKVNTVAVGELNNNLVIPHDTEFQNLIDYLSNFCAYKGQTIKTPQQLAHLMAKKASVIRDVIIKTLEVFDKEPLATHEYNTNSLASLREKFKETLLHDLTTHTFADMYAQTIAYGLFVARLNDTTLENFSRQEARDLVSKNYPFLRQLFDYIAGASLDDNLIWIVDDLAEIIGCADLNKLFEDYGKTTQTTDPFLHFYETFLEKYDKVNKKKRGVYYTPQPIVRFIVSAVDTILKNDFKLTHGLADDTKTTCKIFCPEISHKKSKQYKEIETYKVQILDPATGTGTFLAETIRNIHAYVIKQKGAWPQYVEEVLIPRLNGFEIMMTPYVMCHLKLNLLLQATGYAATNKTKRFNVYLTNALEKDRTTKYGLLDLWLAEEAKEADRIKSQAPLMVILGNPPYSISSCNKNNYLNELMKGYKQDLNEKNILPLSDDYIKFLRMGENYIEKNKEGILAYISSNSFLDGVIFRQMRKHLLQTFNTIYLIDLHGNSIKKECCPDGSKDVNVFDIQQGVSINIFVKTTIKKSKKLAKVYHAEVFGLKDEKFEFLNQHEIDTIDFTELKPVEPHYFFTPKDFNAQSDYKKGFKLVELMPVIISGIKTHHDNTLVSFDKFNTTTNKTYSYRPFDKRYIDYDLNKVVRHRYYSGMKHFILGENVGLILMRSLINTEIYNTVQLADTLSDISFYGFQSYNFPLYLYDDTNQSSFFTKKRTPNLNMDIVHELEQKLQLTFTPEKEAMENTFAPIDILDYIYGVLHSNKYRNKYKEFLKIDFPRIPYPDKTDYFFEIAEQGKRLRQLHLMKAPELENLMTAYPVSGENEVNNLKYNDNKVYINKTQYFDTVPESVWNFRIGGYQPAQKWLKDRKGKTLSYAEIMHYQKIIAALSKTITIMHEIDTKIEL